MLEIYSVNLLSLQWSHLVREQPACLVSLGNGLSKTKATSDTEKQKQRLG